MDLGMVDSNAFMGSSNDSLPCMAPASGTMERGSGSALVTERRSGLVGNEWRKLKMSRTDDDIGAAQYSMQFQAKVPLIRPKKPTFSTPQTGTSSPNNNGFDRKHQNPVLPHCHSQTPHASNAGLGSRILNEIMDGKVVPPPGPGGPFTASQWKEYEYQALILKHLKTNVALPPNLLLYIKINFNPSGLSDFTSSPLSDFNPSQHSDFSAGCSRPNSSEPPYLKRVKEGEKKRSAPRSLRLCLSGTVDPEPLRCRRSDGKKWRCSKDVVAEHRYCERHLNRNRSRSRKHVEHAESGSTTTLTATTSLSVTAASGGVASNSITIAQQQITKTLEHAAESSALRISGLSMSSAGVLKTNHGFPIIKQEKASKEFSLSELGLISSDSALNQRRCNYVECENMNSSPSLISQDSEDPESLLVHHFINDWLESKCDRLDLIWPEAEVQSDRTQLSISIPMGFSGGGVPYESMQKEANSVLLEASMGGLLGEALKLQSNNNSPNETQNSSSAVNSMPKQGLDGNPQLGSSPTDVLQQTIFE